METKAGAIPIRMVIAMIAVTRTVGQAFHLPHIRLPRIVVRQRRRRATIDLIHASPYLLADIGVTEGRVGERGK